MTDREAPDTVEALLAAFDEAKDRCFEQAEESRRIGSKSSIMGEEGVPSHVLSRLRGMVFEHCAAELRSALARPAPPLDPERLATILEGVDTCWTTRKVAEYVIAALSPTPQPDPTENGA